MSRVTCDRVRVTVTRKNERKSVPDSNETDRVVWFGDRANDEKTSGRSGGCKTQDVEVLFSSDEDG